MSDKVVLQWPSGSDEPLPDESAVGDRVEVQVLDKFMKEIDHYVQRSGDLTPRTRQWRWEQDARRNRYDYERSHLIDPAHRCNFVRVKCGSAVFYIPPTGSSRRSFNRQFYSAQSHTEPPTTCVPVAVTD